MTGERTVTTDHRGWYREVTREKGQEDGEGTGPREAVGGPKDSVGGRNSGDEDQKSRKSTMGRIVLI